MPIGLVELFVDGVRYEEKAIIREFAVLGYDVLVNDISTMAFDVAETVSSTSRVAIIRIPSYFRSLKVAAWAKDNGFRVINEPDALQIFGSKIATDRWLSERNLPAIPGCYAFSVHAALAGADRLGYPVVVKPDIGGFGRRVHKAESRTELLQLAELNLDLSAPHNKLMYIQKFVSVDRDIRLITAFGKHVAAMERREGGRLARNIAQGGEGEIIPLSYIPEPVLEGLQRNLPQGVFGTDVLIAKNGDVYVCEVNATCRFFEFDRVSEFNLANIIARDALELARG